ncbi:hypothetical protein JNUCC32_04630 [Paenibacillus sp. JNUCC32]|uniref:hypothetical protein n=1 Tax=unclassified Paenibacillus TaxID=185978 RepID=UPI00178849B7|nr:hypothetical protein [Paenibacillus sp. JNUCC-32]QOT11320.1 hypothetical protein JNUCC32_04630 [Paenibacillus sp. JNUCC-32]
MNFFVSHEDTGVERTKMKYALIVLISVLTFRKLAKIETLKNDLYAALLLLKGTDLT